MRQTLLLADVERVTSWGDWAQAANRRNEPTCLCGERGTRACCAPWAHANVVSPAWGHGLTPHPSWAVAIITEKRRWKCWRVSQELTLAKCACALWGRLVPPTGSLCNVEEIKQVGAASSDSISKLGTGGEQPPCSHGDTPWKWQLA